jgi:hypothetical protein
MEPVMHHSSISAVWADALFVSALQRCDQPSAAQVQQAVAAAVGVFGVRGCAGRVAQEFGDHPETAVTRMRWARNLAAEAICGQKPDDACPWSPAQCPVPRAACTA